MVSVERIAFMTESIPQETQAWPIQDTPGANHTTTDLVVGEQAQAVGPDWPTKGRVEFQHCSVRYRDNLDLVLDDVSFCVEGGEKVGVVGR
jgi:ABC-type multidrug transport system fused ATPase/permease subunit